MKGAGAGDDVDPADRHRGLVAEGVVDVIGLQPQRRGARLDHLLGQQAGRAVIGKGRCPRAARSPGRARPDQPAQCNRRRQKPRVATRISPSIPLRARRGNTIVAAKLRGAVSAHISTGINGGVCCARCLRRDLATLPP